MSNRVYLIIFSIQNFLFLGKLWHIRSLRENIHSCCSGFVVRIERNLSFFKIFYQFVNVELYLPICYDRAKRAQQDHTYMAVCIVGILCDMFDLVMFWNVAIMWN